MSEEVEYHFVPPITSSEREDWKAVLEAASSIPILSKRLEYVEEEFYVRFIRGSAFVKNNSKRIKRIIDTLTGYFKYFDENDIENILSETFPLADQVRKCLFTAKYLGIAHLGTHATPHAVLYIALDDIDHHSAPKYFNHSNLTKHIALAMEVLTQRLHLWKVSSRIIYIIDLKKMSLSDYYSAYKAGITHIFTVLGKNYPESVEKIFILHPPTIFSWCFSMLKPFIEPDTVLKIKLLHGNKIIETLNQDGIPVDVLPKGVYENGVDTTEYVLNDKIVEFLSTKGKTKTGALQAIKASHFD